MSFKKIPALHFSPAGIKAIEQPSEILSYEYLLYIHIKKAAKLMTALGLSDRIKKLYIQVMRIQSQKLASNEHPLLLMSRFSNTHWPIPPTGELFSSF